MAAAERISSILVRQQPAHCVSGCITRKDCCNVLNFETHKTCNEQSLVLWLSLATDFVLSITLAILHLTKQIQCMHATLRDTDDSGKHILPWLVFAI